ncbi:unnamed protein product [Effrenium voratum]|nr:unnamed protein product [Effrenium voratum]
MELWSMGACTLCSKEVTRQAVLAAPQFEPLPASDDPGKALLGAQLPVRPPPVPAERPKLQRKSISRVCCGRPGEPLNKVCLLASTDLEGFLPYRLIISEERGLDFASLTTAPDFSLEPSDVVKVQRISHQAWLEDRAFAFLCRTVKARTDLQAFADWSSKDRWHPPYIHLVHIVAREDPDAKGGLPPDCNILVGTQTEALAEELMRSCLLLKKRRALNRQPSRH